MEGFEMIHKAWCNVEEVPHNFLRSSIKFQGHTGWKTYNFNPIWVRLLGRSQLSNPSDLPCFWRTSTHLCYTINTMAADGLVKEGAWTYASQVLTLLAQTVSTSTTDGLSMFLSLGEWLSPFVIFNWVKRWIKISIPFQAHENKFGDFLVCWDYFGLLI